MEGNKNLEFSEVLSIIAGYSQWDESAKIIKELEPLSDIEDVWARQAEIEEALRLQDDKNYLLRGTRFYSRQS